MRRSNPTRSTLRFETPSVIAADEIKFQWCRLNGMSAPQLHAVLAAREAVFIVEQKCAYQDADLLDQYSWHLTAWAGDRVAAYLRVVDAGKKYAEVSIGRVLTAREHRGTGLGKSLMAEALRRIDAAEPVQAVRISAQAHLVNFYRGYNFRTVSDVYLEDEIPHVEMLRA
jgi:ElaA protein